MVDFVAYVIVGIVVLVVIGIFWGMAKVGWDAEKTQREAKEFYERENAKARAAEAREVPEP